MKKFVLIPVSLVGFVYGMMYDFIWLELLTGGYLASAWFLDSSDEDKEEIKNDTYFYWHDNFNEDLDSDDTFYNDDYESLDSSWGDDE